MISFDRANPGAYLRAGHINQEALAYKLGTLFFCRASMSGKTSRGPHWHSDLFPQIGTGAKTEILADTP